MSTSPSTRSSRTHVLIVDDHPAIGKTLTHILDNEMDMTAVDTVVTAEEAFDVLERQPVDVVVVDLSLPDANGLEMISRLREMHPATPALVFSRHDERIYGEPALLAGARGYVMKTAPSRRIITAIRTVESGDIYLSEEMRARTIYDAPDRSSATSVIGELTDREQAVFERLGRGDSLDEIAEQLDITLKTAEYHRRQAKEKLGLETTSELLQHAIAWFHSKPDSA